MKRICLTLTLFTTLFLFYGCHPSVNIIKNIAKSDVDMIIDISLNEITQIMKQLTIKLYKLNPYEFKKSSSLSKTLEDRVEQIFNCPLKRGFKETEYKLGVEAMLLCFEQNYEGDRVLALISGLYSMILSSYNNKCEIFILDKLNQQKIYNSARNIEVLVWRLKTRLDENKETFLITNQTKGDIENLSFERMFGKMIAIQDITAQVVAGSTNRLINKIVHTAGMAFLPINIY